MKQQKSEPPAVAGGLTQATEPAQVTQPTLPGIDPSDMNVQPPAAAGGSDLTLNQLQAENAELRAVIQFADARAVLTTELGKSGARSPELLFEAVRNDLQFDDEGRPKNVASLIDRLRRQYPEQFGSQFAPSIDAGAGQTPAPRLTRETLARMKPSEIAELDWSEVRRVLAAG